MPTRSIRPGPELPRADAAKPRHDARSAPGREGCPALKVRRPSFARQAQRSKDGCQSLADDRNEFNREAPRASVRRSKLLRAKSELRPKVDKPLPSTKIQPLLVNHRFRRSMRSWESLRRRAQTRPRSGRERLPRSGWVEQGWSSAGWRSGAGVWTLGFAGREQRRTARDLSVAPALSDRIDGRAQSPAMALRIEKAWVAMNPCCACRPNATAAPARRRGRCRAPRACVRPVLGPSRQGTPDG